jgi:hypothetical protein
MRGGGKQASGAEADGFDLFASAAYLSGDRFVGTGVAALECSILLVSIRVQPRTDAELHGQGRQRRAVGPGSRCADRARPRLDTN